MILIFVYFCLKVDEESDLLFFMQTAIDRIEPLLQYCSCSSKTMMTSISNRVHHTFNELDKTDAVY